MKQNNTLAWSNEFDEQNCSNKFQRRQLRNERARKQIFCALLFFGSGQTKQRRK